MIENDKCRCDSGENYSTCCEPYHQGVLAPTAEKLMRSRYAAYALCLPKYLIQTTYPAKRKGLNEQEIIDWSMENKWLKLEIISSSFSVVEFKAYFQDAERVNHIHHEKSTFTQERGTWYYVKGNFY